jgi:hypothetical protein
MNGLVRVMVATVPKRRMLDAARRGRAKASDRAEKLHKLVLDEVRKAIRAMKTRPRSAPETATALYIEIGGKLNVSDSSVKRIILAECPGFGRMYTRLRDVLNGWDEEAYSEDAGED